MEDKKRKSRQTARADASRERHRIQLASAVLLVIVGCALLSSGFFVPPTGVIDSSVLIAFGEILTFVGALFGIDYHYKYKRETS